MSAPAKKAASGSKIASRPAKHAFQRPIDRLLDLYELYYGSSRSRRTGIAASLFWLSGLVVLFWSFPFPHPAFLGAYNSYLNWASFLIAALVYYYYRLSPVFSYLMLFLLLLSSSIAAWVNGLQLPAPFSLYAVPAVLLVAAALLQAGARLGRQHPAPPAATLQAIFMGPLWLFRLLFRRFSFRY